MTLINCESKSENEKLNFVDILIKMIFLICLYIHSFLNIRTGLMSPCNSLLFLWNFKFHILRSLVYKFQQTSRYLHTPVHRPDRKSETKCDGQHVCTLSFTSVEHLLIVR